MLLLRIVLVFDLEFIAKLFYLISRLNWSDDFFNQVRVILETSRFQNDFLQRFILEHLLQLFGFQRLLARQSGRSCRPFQARPCSQDPGPSVLWLAGWNVHHSPAYELVSGQISSEMYGFLKRLMTWAWYSSSSSLLKSHLAKRRERFSQNAGYLVNDTVILNGFPNRFIAQSLAGVSNSGVTSIDWEQLSFDVWFKVWSVVNAFQADLRGSSSGFRR